MVFNDEIIGNGLLQILSSIFSLIENVFNFHNKEEKNVLSGDRYAVGPSLCSAH